MSANARSLLGCGEGNALPAVGRAMRRVGRHWVVVCVAVGVSACGGGGDGKGSSSAGGGGGGPAAFASLVATPAQLKLDPGARSDVKLAARDAGGGEIALP